MVSRVFKTAAATVVAFLLSGCGGDVHDTEAPQPAAQPVAEQKTPAVKVTRDNPCSVMFPNEAGDILGYPSSMREITDEITCHYHFEPGKDYPLKSADGETFVEVKMHWTGGPAAIAAARTAGKLVGSGSGGFEQLSGVGDEAWLAPGASYLVFSKGDVGVEINMRLIPGEKEKAIRIAQLIASRL